MQLFWTLRLELPASDGYVQPESRAHVSVMISIEKLSDFNFESVPIDLFWNTGEEKELKMHRIHSYPAKFPAFLTTKALNYAKLRKRKVTSVADIFCGCGTTAFEAKRNNIPFWGCDINPVATMIARTKSRKYQSARLRTYFKIILNCYKTIRIDWKYTDADVRLKYWYRRSQFNQLSKLRRAIISSTPPSSDYQVFFLCAFSNILKATSVWLTKSIKPQVDPFKKPVRVEVAFRNQFALMLKANDEIGHLGSANSEIVTANFLSQQTKAPLVDLIVTSPPYVTSYEYADLHQLSSLWLDFTADYRSLRDGSIGSVHHDYNFVKEWKHLNTTGTRIVSLLLDQYKSKARSVAKYFLDMQRVAEKAFSMMTTKGMALFVIGNTEYKNVRIDNAKHLAESLRDAGFRKLVVTKRKISNKILTPYRNSHGNFSTDATGRKIYNEEFIIIASK